MFEIHPGNNPQRRCQVQDYEAYLAGALANVLTCTGHDDEALKIYEAIFRYTVSNGITGWSAHANLGTANICYKLGNLKEAEDFSCRAREIYKKIHQEWGLIMSGSLLAACDSRMGTAPLDAACRDSLKRAARMQYGSCTSSIRDLCSGRAGYLKLYFI